ncbi:MAG: hypothetical protein LBD21_02750 [Tannerellaceae bacterium]|jgi:uncharacterized membrane protein YhaH (DUF805 family)|nr:hypothetical protein [Tannerellaceae bacterium]
MSNIPFRTIVFSVSGILVLAGAVLYMAAPHVAAAVFAVGAAGMAVSRLTQPVADTSVRMKRLHTFNVAAALLMVVASVFMFRRQNEWIACLSIAAMLQLYAVFVGKNEG